MPAEHLVGPAVVIDKVAETEANPDYLLTVDDIRAWEAEHGALPENGWLFLRTGWDTRARRPGGVPERRLGHAADAGLRRRVRPVPRRGPPIVGVGVETVGIDAGGAGGFDPPFPVHNYLLGANKYGVTQLANLGRLPATGALVVVAPMKLVGGTGSPVRVLALVPKG